MFLCDGTGPIQGWWSGGLVYHMILYEINGPTTLRNKHFLSRLRTYYLMTYQSMHYYLPQSPHGIIKLHSN